MKRTMKKRNIKKRTHKKYPISVKKGGDPDDLKRFLKDISSILFVYFKNSNESEKKNMLDLLIKLKETGTKDTSTKEKIITKINDIMKEMTPPRKENKEEVNLFIEQIIGIGTIGTYGSIKTSLK